jgi:calcium binding protein 39
MKPKDLICSCLPKSKVQTKSEGQVLQDSILRLKATIETLQDQQHCPEAVQKQLQQLVIAVQGLKEVDQRSPLTEDILDAAELLFSEDIPIILLDKLEVLEFQSRTVATNLCCILLQLGFPERLDEQVLEYFVRNESLLQLLLQKCTEEVATCAGIVLLSCLKHERLTEAFLMKRHLFSLLDLAQHQDFEISTDAFSCLREVVLTHAKISSRWLREENNFEHFFRHYNRLLECENYVVQRQAMKLLSEFLLDRNNTNVMVSYVGDDRHLRVIMNLLRDRSRTLQYEAFHLFKLFVANPNKPVRVQKILAKNQLKLVELLSSLQSITPDDEQFVKDRKCVIGKIQALGTTYTPGFPVTLTLSAVKLEINGKPDHCGISTASTADTDDDTLAMSRTHSHRLPQMIMSL